MNECVGVRWACGWVGERADPLTHRLTIPLAYLTPLHHAMLCYACYGYMITGVGDRIQKLTVSLTHSTA